MTRSRLTRIGVGCALAGGLTVLSAVSTGNNLFYLMYSVLLALFGASWFLGRRNLRGLRLAALDAPGATQGRPASYPLRLLNENRDPSFALRLPGSGAGVARLGPAESADLSLRLALPHRGLNRLEGAAIESDYPFGLWRHRAAGGEPVLLAVPVAPPGGSSDPESSGGTRDSRSGLPGGPGDEFYGARPYDPSDDPRRINWKLTARTGSLFVNETLSPGGGKRTVRLMPAGDVERAIGEAAAACRAGIEQGAEMRLVTPDREVPFGRGPGHLQKLLEALALVGEGATPRPAPVGSPAPAMDVTALRWATRAGGAWVFASLFLIEELAPEVLGALAPLVLLGAWLEYQGGPWLPKKAADALSLAMLFFAVLLDWRLAGVTVATSHLMAYVLLNRALTPPDDRHGVTFLAHFLGFFLVSGQTISLAYFVFFIGYCAYAATWLALCHGASWSDYRTTARPLARALGAALALGVAVFLATPRVEPRGRLNPAAAIGLDRLKSQGSSVIGFSETVALGYFGPLKRSTAKALRVAPVPAPMAEQGPILVRGNAYESFDGHRWTRAPAEFRYRYLKRVYRAADGRAWAMRLGARQRFAPRSPGERAYDISVFPLNTAVVFSVGSLRALEEPSRVSAYMDHLDSAYFAVPYASGVRYLAYSDPSGDAVWPSILEAQALHRRLLQVPPGLDPRIAKLAHRLGDKLATDAERVWAVRDHLRTQYAYSTLARDGRSTLKDFLFKAKRGNCEYFATAAAILLRQLGIPTRLVTGFSAWDWNEYGRFYDVRQSQAHAWVEALVNGRWITVDATPGDESSLNTIGDRFTRYLTALEAKWYSHVIGYDRFAQRNTFYRMSRGLLNLPKPDWRGVATGAAGAAGLCLLWLLWSRGRGADRGLFARAEAAVARAGLKRLPHQTPLEFAKTARERRPGLSLLEDLARLHYRERFGPGLSPQERARARDLLDQLRAVVQ